MPIDKEIAPPTHEQHSQLQKNTIPALPTKAHDHTAAMNFPQEEERILARWKEIDAFLRQVELVSGRAFPSESCKQAVLCWRHVMFTSPRNRKDSLMLYTFIGDTLGSLVLS